MRSLCGLWQHQCVCAGRSIDFLGFRFINQLPPDVLERIGTFAYQFMRNYRKPPLSGLDTKIIICERWIADGKRHERICKFMVKFMFYYPDDAFDYPHILTRAQLPNSDDMTPCDEECDTSPPLTPLLALQRSSLTCASSRWG